MAKRIHRSSPATENHAIHGWEVANAAARAAIVPSAADLGRVARQVDDGSHWICVSYSPADWRQIDPTPEIFSAPAAAAAAAASSAQTASEAARDASLANGKVYVDTAAGLAATTEGAYFTVPSSVNGEALILYRKEAGIAVEKKRYLSSAAFPLIAPQGYVWALLDSQGQAALGVKSDGGTWVKELNGAMVDDVVTGAAAARSALPAYAPDQYSWALMDADGRAPIGVRLDGTVAVQELASTSATIGSLEATSLNGRNVQDVLDGAAPSAADFGGELVFIADAGQSLACGSNGSITTAKEYDNIGFPGQADAPSSYVDLTVAATEVPGRGESPIYGTLGHIKELILEEHGLDYLDHHHQLLGCNDGWDGYAIDALSKGTTPYTRLMSQVTAALAIAQAEGRTCRMGAVTWTQGESNDTMAQATYVAKLVQLAADYDADARAITGQVESVPLISYQCCSVPADRRLALGHLQAAQENPTKIFLACPTYQFSYFDFRHIVAASSKWLGAYYGLVYKRVLIDKVGWEPLWPVSHRLQGKVLNLKFNRKGLVLDTTQVPAQVNYGFDLVDSIGSPLTIASVSVVEPDTVKIVAAASIPAGASLRYGFQNATGKAPFVGGAGNLRDSDGDRIVYAALNQRMDNWCVLFSRAL